MNIESYSKLLKKMELGYTKIEKKIKEVKIERSRTFN
jgi:hypothetical protein